MKTSALVLLAVCLFFALAWGEEDNRVAEDLHQEALSEELAEGTADIASRKMLTYQPTPCSHDHSCGYGYYCKYYPHKYCTTKKVCKQEKVKVCKKYGYGYGYSYSYGRRYHGQRRCLYYGYSYQNKCYNQSVCYYYVCVAGHGH